MGMISRYSVLTLLVCVFVSMQSIGCGYHFRANGKPVGLKIESIAIPLLASSSSEKGFEAEFTRIIREEFISHGNIPIVEQGKADMVLTGTVYEIKTRPLTYDSSTQTVGGNIVTQETTSGRRLKIRLEIKLIDRATNNIIWHENSMEEEARFEVGADPLENRYNQNQALIKISRLLAKRIYMKTMERF